MQKKIIIFLLFLITQASMAQVNTFRCYITVSLDDCVNCLNASKVLLDIPKEFHPTLVFKSQHKKQAYKIVSDVLKITWAKENVIVSDSLYKILVPETTLYSEIHIIDKQNFKFFTCRLTELNNNQNFDKIKSIADIKKYETEQILPDSVVISNNLQLKYKSGHKYIFAYDYLFNKVHIIHKKNKKLFTSIDGKNIDKKEVYKACFGDTSKYYERIISKQKNLESVGKTDIGIVNFFDDKEGNLYTFLSIYYAFDSLKATYITVKVILTKWDEKGKHTYFKTKQASDFFSPYDGNNYIGDIQILDEKMYIMPYAKKTLELDSTLSILAEIDLDKKNKSPVKLKKAYFPIIFKNTRYFYMSYSLLPPYLFQDLYPQFTNFETGEKTKIKLGYKEEDFKNFKLNPNELIFEIINIIAEDDNFYAIIKERGGFFYIIIDKNGNILLKKLLQLPSENISRFIFISKNEIIAINNDNFLITIAL